MAQNIELWGATYSAVPAIEVPKASGGTATYVDEDEIVYYSVNSAAPTSSDGSDGDIWLVV